MSVIECKNVSIRYITGDFKSIGLKDYVIKKLRHDYHVEEFWADRGITFRLEKGDMLGIIGTNGAGKSTLLKAVTGILVPTEGTVKCRGSIAALLELSSGFDGDMTVKENTYLRGALLGYTKKFMNERYREIIEFAELEGFEDRPFKQLSSGMKSRLAFSIACLVDPDIIILDEVLSVGDGAFRRKSGERMREILNNGVTGILVSHSTAQIRELCNKVLWLDHGKQVAFGDTFDICNAYEHFLCKPKKKQVPPKSMKEIRAISRRFQIFRLIEADERAEALRDPEKREGIEETAGQRERRIMAKIAKMTSGELAPYEARLMEARSLQRMQDEDNI